MQLKKKQMILLNKKSKILEKESEKVYFIIFSFCLGTMAVHRNLKKKTIKSTTKKKKKVKLSDRVVRNSTLDKKSKSNSLEKSRSIKKMKRAAKPKQKRELTRFTQNEYLKEAVQTEYDSKRQLMALLMMQEEKKVVLQKDNNSNKPTIKYKMNKLGTTINFPRNLNAKFIDFDEVKEKKKKVKKKKKKPKIIEIKPTPSTTPKSKIEPVVATTSGSV